MKLNKLLGLLLFVVLSVVGNATEYEIQNGNTRIYSTQYKISGSSYKSDSGTIYAYAYMSSGKVKVKVRSSNGGSFKNDTYFAVYKGSISSSNRVVTSSNMKGSSYKYVTFFPREANYRILLATKLSDGRSIGFFINNPIIVKEKAITAPTVSSVSIPTLTKNVKSKICIYGRNFTSNMAFTINDAVCDNNGIVRKSSSTYGYIYCTPRASGSKSWVVKDRSGGNALKRGTVSVKAGTSAIQKSRMLSPTSGSTLTSTSTTFRWSDTGANYYIKIGTSRGAKNLYAGFQRGNVEKTITNLPSNGSWIHVRLYTIAGGSWKYNDYVYKSYTKVTDIKKSRMLSPTSGSTLTSTSTTFRWSDTGANYYIKIGTSRGAKNLYAGFQRGNVEKTITNLPSNGSWIHVRLYTIAGGSWKYNDYVYKSYTKVTDIKKSRMLSPTSGSTLTSTSATFRWSDTGASENFLTVGTGKGTGDLYSKFLNNVTEKTVVNLPSNGSWIHVTLGTKINGSWQQVRYAYKTTSPKKVITFIKASPASGNSYALEGEEIKFKLGVLGKYDRKIKAYIQYHTGTTYLPKRQMYRIQSNYWVAKRSLKAGKEKKYKITVTDLSGKIIATRVGSIEVRLLVSTIASNAYKYAFSQIGKTHDGNMWWVSSRYTYCARLVRASFDKPGKFASAIKMYNHYNNLGLVEKYKKPTKGDVIFYAKHKSNGYYGHVGISDGNGNVISVYAIRTGVNLMPYRNFSANYLGFVKADDYNNKY